MNLLPSTPILKIRDFRNLILTRWTITVAMQIQAVVVAWQVYQIRPDPLLLGLLGLAEAVPAIGGAFYSGHVVDQHRPARIYLFSLIAMFLNGCMLWFAATSLMPLTEDTRLSLFYLGMFISGAGRCFAGPAVQSILPRIVPREMYAASAAWSSTSFQLAAISGPMLGGLLYGWAGADVAFAMIPLFSFFALVGAGSLSQSTIDIRSGAGREPFTQSVLNGVKFVYRDKILLSSLTLDMFSVLFGSAVAILPVYADQILHVGATGLGILRAAPSIGSLLVLVWLAFQPLRILSGTTLLVTVAGFGFSIVAFGLSTNFLLSMLFLSFSGAFDGVSMVIRSTILQLRTPDSMRGRVSSVGSIFVTSSNEIGTFKSGFAASLFGLVPSVVAGGFLTLIVVAMTTWLAPELRRAKIDV